MFPCGQLPPNVHPRLLACIPIQPYLVRNLYSNLRVVLRGNYVERIVGRLAHPKISTVACPKLRLEWNYELLPERITAFQRNQVHIPPHGNFNIGHYRCGRRHLHPLGGAIQVGPSSIRIRNGPPQHILDVLGLISSS